MYIFLVRDPGKQVQCAGSAGGQKANTWPHRVWLAPAFLGLGKIHEWGLLGE